MKLFCCEDCKEKANGSMKAYRIAISTGYNLGFLTVAFLILIVIHFGAGVPVFLTKGKVGEGGEEIVKEADADASAESTGGRLL